MSGNTNLADQGLLALVMLLRLHGLGADPQQIRHRFGASAIGIPEMLRCARELGLKAKSHATTWKRLLSTPLPAIAADAGLDPPLSPSIARRILSVVALLPIYSGFPLLQELASGTALFGSFL